MRYKILLLICLLFYFLISLVYAGGTHSAYISEDDCKITCTNDFTGEEHTIAGSLKATVYADGNDDVGIEWNVYYDGEVTYSKTVGGKDSEEDMIVMPYDPGTPDGIIRFSNNFIEDLIALMFKSTLSFELFGENKIKAIYSHKLDMTCTNSYIEMGSYARNMDNNAYVWCNIYEYSPSSKEYTIVLNEDSYYFYSAGEYYYNTYKVTCSDCDKEETEFDT